MNMDLCTRCAREQRMEKTRALETVEAPSSARHFPEDGPLLALSPGGWDVPAMSLESMPGCHISLSG